MTGKEKTELNELNKDVNEIVVDYLNDWEI